MVGRIFEGVCSKTKVLITGGAGFIGSHLAEALAKNDEVVVFDNLSTGQEENLKDFLGKSSTRMVVGSVLDRQKLEPLVEQADIVYHLAAVVGVDRVIRYPRATLAVNIDGTRNVVDLCRQSGSKLVLASTSEVYGKNQDVPLAEDDSTWLGPTTVPRWCYAVSKLADEHLALASAKEMTVVIVRYFNCYGPRIDPAGYASVIALFIDQALRGEPITVYGDGSQTRSFTYVADTVAATVAAGAYNGTGVFNVGRAEEISIDDLARLIRESTASDSPIVHQSFPARWGRFEETRRRVPNISRAREALGFEAETELIDGIDKTVRWARERLSEVSTGEVA